MLAKKKIQLSVADSQSLGFTTCLLHTEWESFYFSCQVSRLISESLSLSNMWLGEVWEEDKANFGIGAGDWKGVNTQSSFALSSNIAFQVI